MENQKKKRTPIISIVCWILGVCLILAGIIVPKVTEKNKYTFSVDDDGFGSFYEFEVEMNETINPDMAYAKIKVGGVKTKSFKLDYDIEESEDGEYVFTLELFGNDRSMFNEVVELEITTTSGNVLTIENEDMFDEFKGKSSSILLTVVPNVLGMLFIVVGIALLFARKHSSNTKAVNEKSLDKVFVEEREETSNQVVEK